MDKKRKSVAWREYQEKVADLFRRMGCDAAVEETLEGARGKHEIDVVVRTTMAGLPIIWIVECKYWKTAVPKAQVLTLVQIAQDVGADRAFLLSEKGFQAGAVAVVRRANVSLTSLNELMAAAADSIADASIRQSLQVVKGIEDELRTVMFEQRPRNPPPPLLDETITLLGTCFEVTMAAMATMMLRFPVRLPQILTQTSPDRTSEPAEVAAAIVSTLAAIRPRFSALKAALSAARNLGFTNSTELARRVRELLAVGDTLLAEVDVGDAEEAKLRRALDVMSAIGDVLQALREIPSERAFSAVSAPRGDLLDGVYLWLADPARTANRWNELKASTERAIAKLEEATRTLSPSSAGPP
ncbi:restriction endonuclease [Roseomonas sp. HJA6]|uniref:Restriction endonuclease n=2 Tax=Roseomonas alba TaxID=2846776 RepID=A0ABS7AEZ3_9PROT|nr:restriction endonuclease [Neoroseomonas alba]